MNVFKKGKKVEPTEEQQFIATQVAPVTFYKGAAEPVMVAHSPFLAWLRNKLPAWATQLFILAVLCAPAQALSFSPAAAPSVNNQPVRVRLAKTTISASTGYILVDLSSAAVYHHTSTGALTLARFSLEVDRDTTTTVTGAVKLGVISSTATAGATVFWLDGIDFEKSSAGPLFLNADYGTGLRTRVRAGLPLFVVSSDSDSANAFFPAGLNMTSSYGIGNTLPGVGDLVLFSSRTAGTFGITASVDYWSEP